MRRWLGVYKPLGYNAIDARLKHLEEIFPLLPPAEVTELEHGRLWVQQQVLGLDVPMADAKRVDVRQAPEQLVHVQLKYKYTSILKRSAAIHLYVRLTSLYITYHL